VNLDLSKISWPIERAGDAMRTLAVHAGLPVQAARFPPAPSEVVRGDSEACRAWIESSAASLDVQLESKPVTYGSARELLGGGPELLAIQFATGQRLLAISGRSGAWVRLISPNAVEARISVASLRRAIASSLEQTIRGSIENLLKGVKMRAKDRSGVLQSMLDERLGTVQIGEIWRLGLPATAGLWKHARRAGLLGNLTRFLAASGAEYLLWMLVWVLMGKWALEGRFDGGWLLGWVLLLFTLIPIRLSARWEESKLAIAGAQTMMRLLLEGSFKLRPEELRYAGVGQLMGRVLDSEALHSLAVSGGSAVLVASLELLVVAGILGISLKASTGALALLGWIGLTGGLAVAYHRRRQAWTSARIEVTQETIERMVGHRTRLAQQPRAAWHEGEDEPLARYTVRSRRLDRMSAVCLALLPRGWLIAGVAALAPDFVRGAQSPGRLAAQLGLTLLAFAALQKLGAGLAALSGAAIAAERAEDLLHAAQRPEAAGDPAIAVSMHRPAEGCLLEMRDVAFRYPQRAADAVKHNFLEIEEGDRILLQGHSGSGKSTWVALAGGIREPDSGLLFLRGVDRKTLGSRAWRRRVVTAPQFHENHIFAESLAFNVLLGRGWPPKPEDLQDAEAVCRELGLGTLLESMPGGIMQMVGEGGWQLANGEKSRVYLARTLLQNADLLILDETFSALDPKSAQQAMDCVMRRARTVVCVAHV
jgi:ATP-binding cassette, subfamily B, bacterial